MTEQHNLFLNGIRYHVACHGQRTAPPLLLLHGFTGSGRNWGPVLPQLRKHFWILTVDLLGHGRSAAPSDPNRYTMPHAAADLIALLDKWQLERTALLGYSMGGRLALYLACRNPERFSRLVLESSSPGLAAAAERAARRQSDAALADWIEANGIDAFATRWEALPLWDSQQQLSEEIRQQLREQRRQNNPTGLANSLRGMGTGVQPSLWPRLATLNLPTLLIAGALDHKFVAINQQMEDQLPNGRLQIIPQAGHTTHLEQPRQFETAVTQFLTGWVR